MLPKLPSLAGHRKALLGSSLGAKQRSQTHKTHVLCALKVACLYFKASKDWFIAFLIFFFKDNSLNTSPSLTDRLCAFSKAQGKDKGNVNVRLNDERELGCTRAVIHKNELSCS